MKFIFNLPLDFIMTFCLLRIKTFFSIYSENHKSRRLARLGYSKRELSILCIVQQLRTMLNFGPMSIINMSWKPKKIIIIKVEEKIILLSTFSQIMSFVMQKVVIIWVEEKLLFRVIIGAYCWCDCKHKNTTDFDQRLWLT